MVRGIDPFRAHFKEFNDRYVLIGGTACFLALDEAGLDFRATKDLDIVLCVEALDAEFAKAFWDFVGLGKYKNTQKSTGRKLFAGSTTRKMKPIHICSSFFPAYRMH